MSPSRSIDKVIRVRDVPTPDAKDPPTEAGGSFHSVTESTEDPFLISACEDCLTAPAIFVHESAGLLACGVVAAHSFSTRSALDVVSLLCLAKCHRFSFPEIGMDTDCTPRFLHESFDWMPFVHIIHPPRTRVPQTLHYVAVKCP